VGRKNIGYVFAALAVLALIAVGAALWQGAGEERGKEREAEKNEARAKEEINFLLLGLDARRDGAGRTDTIMAVNFDPAEKRITLLSIPRDTRVMLKGSYDKINAAYVYGGIQLARSAVEELLGAEIDRYVIMDFRGFVKIVDLLGGVEVYVPERMYYPAEGIDLLPGLQVLDGEDALAFARYRFTEGGDLDRAKRQQELLKSLWYKTLRIRNVVKIPELTGIVLEYIETDMTKREMAEMVSLAGDFGSYELVTVTLPGESRKVDGLWYYLPDWEEMGEVVEVFKKDD